MDEGRRGGLGQLLGTFANAVLERTLPRIRDWLRARLGPDATLDRIEVDGARLHLFDARVPVGPLVLHVHRATLLTTAWLTTAEDLVSGRAPVRLERLEGELVARDGSSSAPPPIDAPIFTAPIELVGRAGASDAWVDADVTVRGARWTRTRGVGDASPMDGAARLRIATDAWRIDDASFVSGASRVELSARGRVDGSLHQARLDAHEARAGHFLDALAAFSVRSLPPTWPLPWHARLDGSVTYEDRVATVDLSLRADASALELRGRVAPDRTLRDVSLRGALGWEDLGAAAETFAGSTPIDVDVSAEGAAARPDLHVSLRCSAVALHRIGVLGQARLDARFVDGALVVDGALSRGETPIATLTGKGALDPGLGDAGLVDAGIVDAETLTANTSAENTSAENTSAENIAAANTIAARGVVAITPGAIEGPLSFEGAPLEVHLALDGRRLVATTRAEALTVARHDAPGLTLRRLRFRAELGAERTARFQARVGPGALSLEHAAGATKILAQRIDAVSTTALAAILSEATPIGSGRVVWPPDAELWADLALERGVMQGRAHVETARSRVSFLPLRAGRDGLDGTEAVGTIAFADAIDAGLFGARLAPQPVGSFDVVARVHGQGEATALEATLTAASVGWTWDGAPELGVVVLREARAELAIRRGAFEVRALEGELFGGQLAAAGSIRRVNDRRLAALDHLRVVGCGAGLRAWMLGDRAARPGLEGLAADLELSVTPDGVDGRAHVRTDRSDLTLALRARDGRWDERAELLGTLSTRDLAPWLPDETTAPSEVPALRPPSKPRSGSPVRPVIAEARWRIEGGVRGATGHPQLAIHAAANAQAFTVGGARVELLAPAFDVLLDRRAIRWSGLDAGVGGGTMRSRGVVGFGDGFGGAVAELDLDGVRLDALTFVREHLGGVLDGEVRLWRAERQPVCGRGQLTVRSPRYPILARLGDRLARFELPLPPLASDAPLSATLSAHRHGLRLDALEASVPGVRLDATGWLSRAGRLDASGELVAAASWLSESRRLRPAVRALGAVTLPLRLGGTVSRPILRVDALGALDRRIARSALGRGLQRLIDRMADAEPERGGAPVHHPSTGLSSTDGLIDRVAAAAADATEALGELVARGMSPAEIADRVIARRR